MSPTARTTRSSVTANNITHSPKGNPTSNHTTPTCITTNELIQNSGSYVLTQGKSDPDFILVNNYICDSSCQSMFHDIISSKLVKQHYNVYNGKQIKQPRLSAWFGPTSYSFSGCTMQANDPSSLPSINKVCKDIPHITAELSNTSAKPDSYMVNLYRNGNDYIGVHKDDEPLMDNDEPISCLSLGPETRILRLRSSKRGQTKCDIELKPGSLLIMLSGFRNYYHNIPTDQSVRPRASITFRTCNMTCVPPTNSITTSNSTPVPDPAPTPTLTQPTVPTADTSPKTHTQPISSFSDPTYKPTKHPQLIITKQTSSISCQTTLPAYSFFTLDTSLTVINNFYKETLKKELKYHHLKTSGTCNALKERLSTHLTSLFANSPSSNLPKVVSPPQSSQHPTTVPDSSLESISNSISTLEKAILNLNSDITSHNNLLETLLLEQSTNTQTKQKLDPDLLKELNSIDRRAEKLEDSMQKVNSHVTSTSDQLTHSNNSIKNLLKVTTDTLALVKSSARPSQTKTDNVLPPHSTTTSQSNQNTSPNQTPPANYTQPPTPQTNSTSSTTKKPTQNTLIICDSQLKEFDGPKFSSTFKTTTFKAGSFGDFMAKHKQKVISTPEINAYVVQLGVNDLRPNSCTSRTTPAYKKAISAATETLTCLLQTSNTKVAVSLPTPTPNNQRLQQAVTAFNEDLNTWISDTRNTKIHNAHRRLFTIDNRSFRSFEGDTRPTPFENDGLHINSYGLKKLCSNIKFGLFRAFGFNHALNKTKETSGIKPKYPVPNSSK